jgi:hypothetical protein
MKCCGFVGAIVTLLSAWVGRLPATTLANISTRAYEDAYSYDGRLIGGFIITGNSPKRVLLRGIAPSLPLNGVMGDPVMTLFDSAGQLLVRNDDWGSAPNAAEIEASGLAPTNSTESAILITLPSGAYTAHITGKAGTLHGGIIPGPAIAMIEVYDLDLQSDATLANISTRSEVGRGDNVMIGGFIVVGQTPQRVIVRALGPSLPLSASRTVADPILELYDGNGVLLREDDNWRTGGQEAEIIATGLPPPNDLESAIVDTVPPGNYTAIVRGAGDLTGIALVEVYALAR